MPRTAVRFCLITALIAGLSAQANGREGMTGVVRGAEALYVREGPGTEYAAFETLLKGAEVEVQKVEGSWAAIRTSSGRTGYVHATFLELRGNPTPGEAQAENQGVQDTPPMIAAQPPAVAEPPTAHDVAAAQPASAPEPPAHRDPAPAAAPAPPSGIDAKDELLWDVKRILRLTEELHGELERKRSGIDDGSARGMEDSVGAPGVASTLALSGIGIVFGFLLGTLYGRRLERNRRTRVRF